MTKLRVAIVGCRNMGGKHLSCLNQNFPQDTVISGILNSTPQSSRTKAQELAVSYFDNLDDITSQNTDLAIIATPAATHKDIACTLLNKGVSCLVEKPFALNETECQEIIAATDNNPTTSLMVGYIVVFCPAVIALKKDLAGRKISSIRALRTASSYASNTDTTIIQNLMSHDLSVIRFLTGVGVQDFLDISAETNPDKNMQSFAHITLAFKDGLLADLTAEIAPNIEHQRVMYVIDEAGNDYYLDTFSSKLSKNGQTIHQGGNALAEEQAHFIACVKSKNTPSVCGREALEIEKMSLLIDQKFRQAWQRTKKSAQTLA